MMQSIITQDACPKEGNQTYPQEVSHSNKVLAPVVMALVLTMVAGAVALMGWGAADRYLSELNILSPDIAKHAPVLAETPPPRTSRRVVLVIIDGLRLDDSFGHETLDRLRRSGLDAVATSHYPTISRPNHATVVTGVPPLVSGIRNNNFRSPVAIDSLMDRVSQAGLRATYVADDSPSLGYLFGEDFASLYYGGWPGAFTKSTQLAMADPDNSLLVLIPGLVDLAGHEHGGDSPEYRQAVGDVDGQLGESLRLLDLQQDTVIITADHGHTDKGGHGGEEDVVMRVPLVMAGAGIRSEALLGSAQLIDIAPTAAALLGLPAPGHAFGRTLTEVLDLPPESIAILKASDEIRIRENVTRYEDSLRKRQVESTGERRSRLLLLAGLLVLGLGTLELSRRAGALNIDWRVLIIAVPAYPLCYYGLLDLLGQSLSFSALQDRGSEMSSLSRFGLVATFVQVLTGWIALRGRIVLRDRLASANALVACGLLVAWVPAALLWASYGSAPHVEVPSSRVALLIPANYIAVATYAVGASVLLTMEIVVFFARAIDPRIRLRRLERAAARERRRLEKGE
ncbi:MAG: hypothetical protein GY811_14810 [Myxococcales bacterium]|nr:hypothetical protein [Myxococcales bacterium]